MIDHATVGQLLRGTFGGRSRDLDLDALSRRADAALATVAAQPGLHPLMRATLAGLYGADNVVRLETAMQEAHGAGDALLVEYDAAEQARFEASCAREESGEEFA